MFGDIGLDTLQRRPGLECRYFEREERDLSAEAVRDCDAVIILGPRVTAATLAGAERLAIVARFGVGYDNIDVTACTAAGVVLTITPDGVRRPVAAAALTFMLALSQKVLIKDRLTRAVAPACTSRPLVPGLARQRYV